MVQKKLGALDFHYFLFCQKMALFGNRNGMAWAGFDPGKEFKWNV